MTIGARRRRSVSIAARRQPGVNWRRVAGSGLRSVRMLVDAVNRRKSHVWLSHGGQVERRWSWPFFPLARLRRVRIGSRARAWRPRMRLRLVSVVRRWRSWWRWKLSPSVGLFGHRYHSSGDRARDRRASQELYCCVFHEFWWVDLLTTLSHEDAKIHSQDAFRMDGRTEMRYPENKEVFCRPREEWNRSHGQDNVDARSTGTGGSRRCVGWGRVTFLCRSRCGPAVSARRQR